MVYEESSIYKNETKTNILVAHGRRASDVAIIASSSGVKRSTGAAL